jgi:hypothetical protein
MTPPKRLRVLIGLAGALAMGGCATPSPSGQQQASAAKKAACRERANEVYAKQNRAEVYNADTYQTDTLDSPFSTSGLPGITTRGLSGEYERQNMISDCLNDAAGNVGNSGNDMPQPAAAAATPGKLPASLSPLAVPPAP